MPRYLAEMPEAQAVRSKWDSRVFYMETIRGLLDEFGGIFPDTVHSVHWKSQLTLLRTLKLQSEHLNVGHVGGKCHVCGGRVSLSPHRNQ